MRYPLLACLVQNNFGITLTDTAIPVHNDIESIDVSPLDVLFNVDSFSLMRSGLNRLYSTIKHDHHDDIRLLNKNFPYFVSKEYAFILQDLKPPCVLPAEVADVIAFFKNQTQFKLRARFRAVLKTQLESETNPLLDIIMCVEFPDEECYCLYKLQYM